MTTTAMNSIVGTAPPVSAATTSSASGGTAGASTTASGTLSFTQNFNTFLTLLTTQLQNQDPLSPMDTGQFTQQLVAFSQVEQQIDTNNNLQQLIQLQNAGETISATPLVGDTIQYNSATSPLANGAANYSYTLPSSTSTTELAVQDSQGNILYTTPGQTAAGTYNFSWNGVTNGGQQLTSVGPYTLNVIATGATGGSVTATVQAIGQVTGVDVNSGTATFNVSGVTVPMSELVAVNPVTGATTTTTTTN